MKKDQATVIEHGSSTVSTSMHVNSFGRITMQFCITDAQGVTTTKVFDLVERSQHNTSDTAND